MTTDQLVHYIDHMQWYHPLISYANTKKDLLHLIKTLEGISGEPITIRRESNMDLKKLLYREIALRAASIEPKISSIQFQISLDQGDAPSSLLNIVDYSLFLGWRFRVTNILLPNWDPKLSVVENKEKEEDYIKNEVFQLQTQQVIDYLQGTLNIEVEKNCLEYQIEFIHIIDNQY